MKKIFDCFTFFQELDLLEFRLKYLNSVVDYFVIVESNLTHSGKSKPYYFEENRSRYDEWKDKIIYIPIEQSTEGLVFSDVKSYTPTDGAWVLENQQRNALSFIDQYVDDDDIVMLGDLDEIPSIDLLHHNFKKETSVVHPTVFSLLFHYYYMNCQNEGFERQWNGTVIMSGIYYKGTNPQHFRDNRNFYKKVLGGYHFSFLGGIDKIRDKIKSFAHTEFNREDILSDDHIIKCLEEGHDIFNRPGVVYKFYPLDWYEPEIRTIMQQYPQFIKQI